MTKLFSDYLEDLAKTTSHFVPSVFSRAELNAGFSAVVSTPVSVLAGGGVAPLELTTASTSGAVTVLNETFDTALGFTVTNAMGLVPFFSDGSGDYLGINDGLGGGDYGVGATPSRAKAYDGNDGAYLEGQDLDGEGASLPIQITFSGLDISGLANLNFSGDFAEFFDAPGDIDGADFLRIEVAVDGGVFANILEFRGNDPDGTNGLFAVDTDLDGLGDGASLTGTFQTFSAAVGAVGATLDLRLTISVNAGDEDFAIDNFLITGEPSAPVLVTALNETFDNDARFTVSNAAGLVPFFSDGSGDYFGINDGMGGGNYGAGTPPTRAKDYSGFDGSYLEGQDIDGEGFQEPYQILFAGIDIIGLTNLSFSGDFAEFFDDPGDIDASDFLLLEYQIDGGGYQNLLAFEGADFSSASGVSNGVFRQDTDFDGEGDGLILAGIAQNFLAAIAGTGSSLDLRFTVSVDAGDEDFAVDNFIVTGLSNGGQVDITPPTLVATTPADDGVDINPMADITLTFDEAVVAGLGTITIFNSADDSVFEVLDVAGPNVTFSGTSAILNPTNALATSTDYYVLVDSGAITDNAGNVFAGIVDPTALNFTTQAPVQIGDVQGSGDISPFVGQVVTLTGVVIGDYQTGNGADGDLGGFYIQDPFGDGDASTSDGIFIFTGSNNGLNVSHGDTVTITGTVEEFFNQTQVNAQGGAITIDSAGFDISQLLTTIDFETIDFTTNSRGQLIANLEAFEGMFVNFAQTITVAGNDNLDGFGEIAASAVGRLFQYTQNNLPDQAGFAAYQEFVAANTFLLDDGFNGSGNPIRLPDGSFSEADEFRLGDTSANVFGVLGYGFNNFRLRPVDLDEDGNPYNDVTFENTNPRPDGPPDVGGTIQVASMNVLNFFSTIDASGARTELGFGPRGADSQAEFDRQLDKLVSSVIDAGAEVYGLIEIENDFNGLANNGAEDAIQILVDALNAEVGTDMYAFVDPGRDFVGSDAIANAFIYDTTKVRIAEGTSVAILDDSVVSTLAGFEGAPPIFDGRNTSRPAIAVTFEEIATGETFTVVVNHFKSKGGRGTGDDADQNDGQASFNAVRVLAAQAIQAWLETNPTGAQDNDVLIIGDLNAYAQEDPIRSFTENGYTDLASGDGEYSFEFANQLGTLDYGLANAELAVQVTGAAHYHINADEADALNYNTEVGDDTLFNGDSAVRHSDHDPLLIGLNLAENVIDTPVFGNFFFGTFENDRISGTDQSDIIFALSGDDKVSGNDGDDQIFGGDGNDQLNGNAGNDFIFAGNGDDLALGGEGNDRLFGRSGDDVLDGGVGNDLLKGDRGSDILVGGEGRDRLFGGRDDDLLHGGAGDDTLLGGAGDDVLIGGAGDDTLRGGRGADIFVFRDGDGDDVIRSFSARNDAEKIDLSQVSEITDFTDLITDHITSQGRSVLISYGDDSITLNGVRFSDLDANDFIFA